MVPPPADPFDDAAGIDINLCLWVSGVAKSPAAEEEEAEDEGAACAVEEEDCLWCTKAEVVCDRIICACFSAEEEKEEEVEEEEAVVVETVAEKSFGGFCAELPRLFRSPVEDAAIG